MGVAPHRGLRTPRSWDDALEAARGRPGAWARLATYRGETSAYEAARKLRRSPALADEAPAWEVAARRLPEGGSALYARYRPAVTAAAGGAFGGDAPRRAHSALRDLITAATSAEVAAVLGAFVQAVGGRVVPFVDGQDGADGHDVVPVDLSMGSGLPVAAAAPTGTVARAVLEDLLPPLVEDAHRLLALRRAAGRGHSPAVGEMRMEPRNPGSEGLLAPVASVTSELVHLYRRGDGTPSGGAAPRTSASRRTAPGHRPAAPRAPDAPAIAGVHTRPEAPP